MMKKVIPVLLVLLMLLTLPVSAADGKLTATAATSGQTVTVTVHLQNPGIIATRLFIRYDADVLGLERADNGEVFDAGKATFGNNIALNPYTVLWDDGTRRDNNTTSGTLCTLTFTVKGGTADGKTAVYIDVDASSTFNVNVVCVPIESCVCTVDVPVKEPPITGKVRSVTADDLSLIYKADAAIRPIVTADSGVAYTVAYSGYDSRIISVNESGSVRALKAGTTRVTVTASDAYGNTETCTCTVTIRYVWWQILIRIFLLGFIWY